MISVFGLTIRYYGLMFAFGFLFGYLILRRIYRREGMPDQELDKLAVYMFVGTILGARLGHCFFYEPAYYLANPKEVLMVWKGGLASHGGAIGNLIAIWLFSRSVKRGYLYILDRVVIVVALAGFFIRMGNLFNSEIYGVATNLPWAFNYPHDPYWDGLSHHPTQLYEGLAYLLLFFGLLSYYNMKNGIMKNGVIFGWFLVIMFTVRFFVEFVKIEQVEFEQGMALNMGQILSIPLVLSGIWILWKAKNRDKPELPPRMKVQARKKGPVNKK